MILYAACSQHKILTEESVKSSSKILRKSFLHVNHLHFAYSSLKLSCTCQAIETGGEQSREHRQDLTAPLSQQRQTSCPASHPGGTLQGTSRPQLHLTCSTEPGHLKKIQIYVSIIMENNSSKDRRGGKLTDPICHPHTLSNSVLCLPCEVSPGSRPRLCFSLPSARTALPLPRGSAEPGSCTSPQPALPTALQLHHSTGLARLGQVCSDVLLSLSE